MTRAKYLSRREVLMYSSLLLASTVAPAFADTTDTTETSPIKWELAMAALGQALLKAHPDTAERLSREALGRLGENSLDAINWLTAKRFRNQASGRPSVAAEVDAGRIVFVDGWLLTEHEAQTALLYAAAASQSDATGLSTP